MTTLLHAYFSTPVNLLLFLRVRIAENVKSGLFDYLEFFQSPKAYYMDILDSMNCTVSHLIINSSL